MIDLNTSGPVLFKHLRIKKSLGTISEIKSCGHVLHDMIYSIYSLILNKSTNNLHVKLTTQQNYIFTYSDEIIGNVHQNI